MARPQKPYRPTWGGDPVVGLYRCDDGRWRINATGEKFTCHDERQAVARFLHWKAKQQDVKAFIQIPLSKTAALESPDVAGALDFVVRQELGPGRHRAAGDRDLVLEVPADADDPLALLRAIPEEALYAYLRQQLIDRPAHVAQMTGLPQLAAFGEFSVPKPPVRVAAVIAAYREHSAGSDYSEKQALAAFGRLVDHAGARTLADLTDEKLMAFRADVLRDPKLTSSGTIAGYFNRIRSVLSLSKRGQLDTPQIDDVLRRCKAKLYAPENNVEDDPRPVSREDFHKLLDGCARTDVPEVWRAMLLLGLNCALYMEEVCDLRSSTACPRGTRCSCRPAKCG